MSELKIFGIRHHGPGSARSLRKALEQMVPDIVLLEGPPEATDLIPMIQEIEMEPPVALLLYRPDDLRQASYYPFATFSPEWQAMEYAVSQDIPARFIDLPFLKKEIIEPPVPDSPILNDNGPKVETQDFASKQEAEVEINPLRYLARIAGYQEEEQWWEAVIEQRNDVEDIFENILQLMGELRKKYAHRQTKNTLQREAFMRKNIRLAQKEGFQKIAVVCGAWHAPVLADMPTQKEDNAKLKGMKKAKVAATWIPWTYERLSNYSGYGAGIQSPAWYELLFHNPSKDVVVEWMARTAHLFRKEGQDSSPGHVIEAVRLANTLAHLRGRTLPFLEDFMESVQTVFCFGNSLPLALVKKELVIGQKMGRIPRTVPILPLQRNIAKLQKSYRLKVKSTDEEVVLDLRKALHLDKSCFLHRLDLLQISWGKIQELRGTKGSFKECWVLFWEPEMELQVIEAATWGNTVESACQTYVAKQLEEDKNLPELTVLLNRVLQADLPELLDVLLGKVREKAAVDNDMKHLMLCLPSLINMERYGDIRRTDNSQIKEVITTILPRLIIGLPAACKNVQEGLAADLFKGILAVNKSLQLLQHIEKQQSWRAMLNKLATEELVHAKIAGGAARILFEGMYWEVDQMEQSMGLALSAANEMDQAAAWLEGFLHGSALLLIHNPSLFHILDDWVSVLKEENFTNLLPLIRRSFSKFEQPERKQLGQLAKREGKAVVRKGNGAASVDRKRVALALPILGKILGVKYDS